MRVEIRRSKGQNTCTRKGAQNSANSGRARTLQCLYMLEGSTDRRGASSAHTAMCVLQSGQVSYRLNVPLRNCGHLNRPPWTATGSCRSQNRVTLVQYNSVVVTPSSMKLDHTVYRTALCKQHKLHATMWSLRWVASRESGLKMSLSLGCLSGAEGGAQ